MRKVLSVKNLRISFRTTNGKVQAVRDISFELNKGETLAIVGESGSGKSVTCRAILGILAGNAIVEGGEIIYDGKDLLKITEDDFHLIRGDKIAMIFQDPLSSLNPIVRIGKQLTEAMILKNRAKRRSCRKAFNSKLKCLENNMNEAMGGNTSKVVKAENAKKCKDFDTFERTHLKLEGAYNDAIANANNAIDEIKEELFLIEKNATKDISSEVKTIVRYARKTANRFVVRDAAAELTPLIVKIDAERKLASKSKNYAELSKLLGELSDLLKDAVKEEAPNFFSLAYYLTFVADSIPEIPVAELNVLTHTALDEKFMFNFIDDAQKGFEFAREQHNKAKHDAIDVLTRNKDVFNGTLDKKTVKPAVKAMRAAVKAAINRLDINKDSTEYTFAIGLESAVDKYFFRVKQNVKEQKRFDKESARHAKKSAKGRTPAWTVVPADVIDLELLREQIVNIVNNMIEHYGEVLNAAPADPHESTIAIIDYLKEQASGVVYRVTRAIAKNTAIKLMEEVGIAEPRKRYRQYPFEFSGGMRQRIVIAIALAANPDILICDEPTTALDVTIQAQILELINKLKNERKLSVIFITHDLGVVANMADRIAVMYAGKIVEFGTADEVFYDPRHPYTWALLSSMPDLDTTEKIEAIPGTPPNMIYPPKGDAFAARNKYAMKIDFEQQPPEFEVTESHWAATWLLHPDAPKVEPPKIVTERIQRCLKKEDDDNE